MEDREMITNLDVPMDLDYCYTAGQSTARFLRHVKEGRIVGQRCPSCNKVYVPPRGCCSGCGVVTEEEVEVSQKGTLERFTIVHIPIHDSAVPPPFILSYILLDGADIAFMHLVSGVPNEQVRIGMRVEAVWRPKKEWDYTMENILYFKPIDEPDVNVDERK
jgi:uncharacterized OB-fold protein